MRTLLLLLVVFSGFVHGAVISGELYDYSFNLVRGVVEINSTPRQVAVAANGSYSFEVPNGTYLLSAVSSVNQTASQEVVVFGPGVYRIDLIVFDEFDFDDPDSVKLLDQTDLPDVSESDPGFDWSLVFLAVALFAGVGYLLYLRAKAVKQKPGLPAAETPVVSSKPVLGDEQEVLDALSSLGGLTSQKELRKKLPHWSEARVSLVVSALESQGKLSKVKRGRANILRKN